MTDDVSADSNDGRRRRRRRRGKNKNKNNNKGRNRGNKGGRKRRSKTPDHKFGGRDPVASDPSYDRPDELTAFELFCSYHLGIFENNQYRDPSIKQVARLFKRSVDEIRDALYACGLDNKSVKETGYDLSLARLDVKVAPKGIDKKELAKNLFDEFNAEYSELDPEWTESDEYDDDEYDDEYEDSEVEETA